MLKVIKDSQLCKVVIGAYSNDKAAGLYDRYAQPIMEVVAEWMERTKEVLPQEAEGRMREGRGRIIEEMVSPSKEDREEVKLTEVRDAVNECFEMIANKNFKQVYNSIIRTDEKKPRFVKLASCLPTLSP